MYAVGHFALGYLTGKIASKSLNINVNLPLLFFASIVPDIDLLIHGLEHRGPLHSVIFFSVLFVPLLLLYRKSAVPYFVAVLQHLLIGDFLTGGAQLLWPLSVNLYGLHFGIANFANIALELVLFLVSIAIMFKTKDVLSLFKYNSSNMIISIPVVAVLLPTVISFPLYVPPLLLVPHIVYLTLFCFSIFMDLKSILTKNRQKSSSPNL